MTPDTVQVMVRVVAVDVVTCRLLTWPGGGGIVGVVGVAVVGVVVVGVAAGVVVVVGAAVVGVVVVGAVVVGAAVVMEEAGKKLYEPLHSVTYSIGVTIYIENAWVSIHHF